MGKPIRLAAVVISVAACSRESAPPSSGQAPDASTVRPALPASAAGPNPLPAPVPAKALDPNPLRLPPRRVKLDPGRRVFTFSERMLQGAKLGSTLVLYPATVSAFDGDDLVVEGKEGPSYKVHAGYVIPVPDVPQIRQGDAVLTEWNLVAKHAVVKKITKERVTVRYTDMDPKTPEGQLPYQERLAPGGKSVRFVKQVEGLAAGNYAALQSAGDWQHVLLVSPAVDGDRKRWFALGYGGAAVLADEADLRPIPIRFKGKPSADVYAEWVGSLRKASVVALDDPAFFTVKFERAGRPATVGWGFLMNPP
jgi:hypothetical protein